MHDFFSPILVFPDGTDISFTTLGADGIVMGTRVRISDSGASTSRWCKLLTDFSSLLLLNALPQRRSNKSSSQPLTEGSRRSNQFNMISFNPRMSGLSSMTAEL